MSNVFVSGKSLIDLCNEKNIKISEAAVLREIELTDATKDDIAYNMLKSWMVMRASVCEAYESDDELKGKIIGGESKRLVKRINEGKNLCGNLISKAVAYSMGVLEVNANMGVITAAPTAGSSGVMPGAFVALQEEYNFSDEEIVKALLNAAAVGEIISRNATVAGAEGGCQAEVGAASAMTASAIVELFGGSPEQSLQAASIAIANLLGLVCDPVAGLVEAPCQYRNTIGATGAIIAAEIILSGSINTIPFDEMVEAMYDVGKRLPVELRETALGGTAATPTACAICKKLGITIEKITDK